MGQRQLELGRAVFGMKLQPVQPGGVQGVTDLRRVVEAFHQAISPIRPAGKCGRPVGSRIRCQHHPLELKARLQSQSLLLQMILL